MNNIVQKRIINCFTGEVHEETMKLTPEEITAMRAKAKRFELMEKSRSLTESEVNRMLIARQINTLAVDDNTALRMVEFYPEWTTDTDYATGFKVQYGGTLYKCLQAHTAQADWTPEAAPSLWAKVLIPDPDVIPEWEQPESTNPYMQGDKVTHNGKTWVSDVDNNVWEPGVYGWTETNA